MIKLRAKVRHVEKRQGGHRPFPGLIVLQHSEPHVLGGVTLGVGEVRVVNLRVATPRQKLHLHFR